MKKAGKILMMCAVLFLAACGKGDTTGTNSLQEESNTGIKVNTVQEQGQGQGQEQGQGQKQDQGQRPEWVYVPEVLEIGGSRTDYGDMQLIGDTLCYIPVPSEEASNTSKLCRYSLTDKALQTVSVDWQADGAFWEKCAYTFDQDYNAWLMANVYSADYSQLRRFLCKFDTEGKIIFSQEVTEELGRGMSIGGMRIDGKGRLYVYSNEYSDAAGIWLYTDDGSFHGFAAYDTSEPVQVKGTAETEDGRFCVCISKGDNQEYCTLVEVDFEGSKVTELIEDFPNIDGFCVGSQYDFLLYDNTYAYGCNLSAWKNGYEPVIETLFAWADNDVNGYFVTNLGMSEDGRYFCMVEDWRYDDRCVIFLEKTKAEDVPPRTDLVLATINEGSELMAMAVRYNRNNSQYHLAVKNYKSLTDLYNAVLAKEAIDILDLSGLNVEKLAKQGFFENLAPYLEQSEKFGASDFVDGILTAYTFDGVLVGIPEAFSTRTLVGDETRIGGVGLSLDGLLAEAKRNPGSLPFDGPYKSGVTREEAMQHIMMFNEDSFIDQDTGECHFDSETFQEILELCSRFPDSETVARQGNLEEEVSLPSKLQYGEVLFSVAEMKDVKDFQIYEAIFGEAAACIGFPTADGKGGTLLYGENAFGISAASENKTGAWKFVESIPDWRIREGMDKEDIFVAYSLFLSKLPVLKKSLDSIVEYRIEDDLEWIARGHTLGKRTYQDGWSYDYHIVTEDEVNALIDLLKDAAPAFSIENDEIIKIINEEVPSYYSGQKRVEDVVGVIQNRVQLYVNENR